MGSVHHSMSIITHYSTMIVFSLPPPLPPPPPPHTHTHSSPSATISWEKDGVRLVSSQRISFTQASRVLTLQPVAGEDQGRYTCIANQSTSAAPRVLRSTTDLSVIGRDFPFHIHTHTHTHTQTHTNTHKHTHTHTNTHKHTQTHTNTHKHTNIHKHTNTHKHTQTNASTHTSVSMGRHKTAIASNGLN